MKCFCCRMDFDSELTQCPRCGFPVLLRPDGTQITEEDLKDQIKAYRQELAGEKTISIARYFWKKQGEKIALDRKEYVKVADGVQLLKEGRVWLNQKFARTVSSPRFELHYRLRDGGQEQRIFIEVPKSVSFWQLGAELNGDMSFSFLLKSGAEITKTEPISLL